MKKRRRRLQLIIFILGGVAFLAMFFLIPQRLVRVPQLIQRGFVVTGTWGAQVVQNWTKAATISPEKLKQLEEQRDHFALEAAEVMKVQQENEELRALLGFIERQHYQSITSAIVSRSISTSQSTFVIDRGSQDEVVEGAPVVSESGVFLGKIISTTATTATVSVLTNPTSATAATLLNESRTMGIAQGNGGGVVLMKYIPHDEEVELHDIVVTSGLEEYVPSGLIIGGVNAVTTDQASPFQEAIIEPFGDSDTLTYVTVLIPVL